MASTTACGLPTVCIVCNLADWAERKTWLQFVVFSFVFDQFGCQLMQLAELGSGDVMKNYSKAEKSSDSRVDSSQKFFLKRDVIHATSIFSCEYGTST